MRKTYLNAGDQTVDNGMVSKWYNALRYYNVYSDCDIYIFIGVLGIISKIFIIP